MLVRPFLALLVTLLPPGHGLGDMASGPGATRSARCSTTTSRDDCACLTFWLSTHFSQRRQLLRQLRI